MGRQNLETRLVESLLVVCLSVFAISNGCSKDSCCAHKGLVTNWPHHNMSCLSVVPRMVFVPGRFRRPSPRFFCALRMNGKY